MLGLDKRPGPADFPCIVRFHEGNVGVSILQIPLPCGHDGYAAHIEYHLAEVDEWVPIAFIRDFALDETIDILQQAKACIGNLLTE